MQPEKDLAEALETAMGKTHVNWSDVRRLCEEIDRQRKQADAVAKRLLGRIIWNTSWDTHVDQHRVTGEYKDSCRFCSRLHFGEINV
jgi:hypothetical protein